MRAKEKYKAIYRNREKYSISEMCRYFAVSRSGYYSWLSKRDLPDRDEDIARMICQRRSMKYGKSLGCRRMQKWLAREMGVHHNFKTVWRIMQKYGLLSECRRHRIYRTQNSLHTYGNLLARNFYSARPDTKWVTDITYIPTSQGTLFLSAILDLHDRHIVSYKMSTRNDCRLVYDTVRAAMKKKVTAKPQLHSDQGFQYTSHGYLKLLQKYNITPSMSRPATPHDNAVMECFFGIFKTEALRLYPPQTLAQARTLVHDYIHYYNTERMLLK